MEQLIDREHCRVATVGFGNRNQVEGSGLDVEAMIRLVSEGWCPGCNLPLTIHLMTTYHHRNDEPWGCCECCGRGWMLEMRDADAPPYVITAACRVHAIDWDCDHPLPGGSWTPKKQMALSKAAH